MIMAIRKRVFEGSKLIFLNMMHSIIPLLFIVHTKY